MAETQRRPRGLRSGGGAAAAAVAAAAEIVEVQGGHIVRATGRKDRHSKVCTAKGLRDRRVRLSAHTAIQFYDVQDRLGYDRPSKAVDWLIKNAKPAIDQLAQLPPWRPPPPPSNTAAGEKPLLSVDATHNYAVAAYGFRGGGSGLLPPSLDSDSIADTIKSFFPMAAATASSSSSAYQAYPSVPDLLSHGGGGSSSSQAEDLRLSLQSFQDPIFEHQHSRAAPTHQALFAFDAGGSAWTETSQRAATWNLAEPALATGGGGYLFGVPPQLAPSQFFTQWGPLQSSNPPSFRAMADPNALASASGNQMHLAAYRSISSGYPQAAAIRAASTGDVVGFSGFHIPARMRGGEEEHGGVEEPPSASSASRH